MTHPIGPAALCVLLTVPACFGESMLVDADDAQDTGSSEDAATVGSTDPDPSMSASSLSTAVDDGASTGESSGDVSSEGPATGTSEAGESSDATSSSTSGSTDASSSDAGSSSDGGCTPGALGCECEADACDGATCADGVCVAIECGNAILDGADQCDDGNAVAQDGCEADCTKSPGVAAIHLGDQHACARFHDGRIRCFGDNDYGKLGYGNVEDIGDDEDPAAAGDVDLGGDRALDVAAGREHTCVILEGGRVRCWGLNNAGQLGLPSIPFQSAYGDEPAESPALLDDIPTMAPAVSLALGTWHTCALLEGGDVQCWGLNAFGACGYGTPELWIGDDEPADAYGTVDLGGTAIALDSEGDHTCALIDDGSVRCWGLNDEGQLGTGDTAWIGDDEVPADAAIALPAAALSISAGLRFTCARLVDDTVRCWGRNAEGQAGLGHVDPTLAPGDAVEIGADVELLAVGAAHACARLDNGRVRCWGDANFGRLGYGPPEQDVGDDELPSTEAFLDLPDDPVLALDLGSSHSCARMGAGEVFCWGASVAGQAGRPDVDYLGDDETLAGFGYLAMQ